MALHRGRQHLTRIRPVHRSTLPVSAVRVNHFDYLDIEDTNPFYDLFVEKYIQSLSEVECREMLQDIGHAMGLEVTDDFAAEVYRESGVTPVWPACWPPPPIGTAKVAIGSTTKPSCMAWHGSKKKMAVPIISSRRTSESTY